MGRGLTLLAARFHRTTCRETRTMLQRDHSQRHAHQRSLRNQWRLLDVRWLGCHCLGLLSCALAPPPDLLGSEPRRQILLRGFGVWLDHSSHWLSAHFELDRSFFSLWKCLSYQPQRRAAGLLGPIVGLCRPRNGAPVHHHRLLHPGLCEESPR